MAFNPTLITSIVENTTHATKAFFENIREGIMEAIFGGFFNALNYGAKVDGRRFKGVTCTVGGEEVKVPGASFTSADIGKVCCAYEDFATGTIRTIASIVSGEVVKLNGAVGINLTAAGYFIYGTDDSAALTALFAAAKAEPASTPTVTFNEPKGGGLGLAVIPAENEGFCMVASQVTVPAGCELYSQAMIVNMLTSRTTPFLVFAPYSASLIVHGEAMGGCGVQFGEAAGTQADVRVMDFKLWRVGEASNQIAWNFLGSGFLVDLLWSKGGTVGVNGEACSDCTINRGHIIGAAEPVKLISTNQFRAFFILDSCGRTAAEIGEGKAEVDGVAIEKECSDIRVEAQQFIAGSAPARKLKAVIATGRHFVSGGNNINLKLSAQAELSGGAIIYLSHCEDVEFSAQGSNKKTPSGPTPGAENEITFGVEYGANAEGTIRGTGEGSSSIKPYTGTIAGTMDWTQKGVTYHYQSFGFAPTITAGANAGTSPPAPGKTDCSDQSGFVTFGTGTTPAEGAQVVVAFANNATGMGYQKNPKVSLQAENKATEELGLYVTSVSRTGFTVSAGSKAPAASQANTTYAFNYIVST